MEKKILGATIVIVAVVIAAAAATVVVYSSDDDNDLSAYSADVQIPEGASTRSSTSPGAGTPRPSRAT